MFRVIVHRGQARSYRRAPKSVGAVPGRDWGDAVHQTYRVIVHREQARLLQKSAETCGSGACPRFGRLGSSDIPRHRSSRASSAPTEELRNLWERCLPAIGATRFLRYTASSFIASKVERHPGRSYRDLGRPLEPGLPANQATRSTASTIDVVAVSLAFNHTGSVQRADLFRGITQLI